MTGVQTCALPIYRLTFSANAIFRIDNFCEALGKDAAKEFGGQEIDVAFLTDWAETLLGEMATISVKMGKPSSNADSGEVYPPKPEVKKYAPFGSAKSVGDLLDIDGE